MYTGKNLGNSSIKETDYMCVLDKHLVTEGYMKN